MNVALIMERIETWRGGAETSTIQFAAHLAQLGCSITILTTSHAQSTPSYRVVPIAASSTFRATKTLAFIRRATRYLATHPFDIVHAITPCPVADVYQPRGGTVPETLERNRALRSAALQRGLKRLGQRFSLKYRVVETQERRLLTRTPAPWVIAISQYVADQLVRHYAFDPSRIRLIFNGVDPDLSTPDQRRTDRRAVRKLYGLADDDLMVLCVAHNFKLKGVGKLIEALALSRTARDAARNEMYAVIVGRDNPTSFIRLAERLGVTDRIFFAGPTQRISAFFHAADILAHPTFYDPCSRVALEAMASGVPVITTRFNGAAELIRDGENGCVIDSPDDVGALADRLVLLADDDRRRRITENTVDVVRPFSMARHAAKVRELYDEIIAQQGLRSA